ncbi:hypothetical protein TSAR_008110 [Trichomalopsis sarcophagae]|uniref:Uncharacterized protein n=1 Tax=Trichomalopsis sarcophagae TaxID=543379 RepID=A0A232EUB2_9HYME|nr:hypothetical protein TSAR_008110 [Trichomalopsis sarcophagae]
MNLLLRYGAKFYACRIYCLAREISERRFVNLDDLRTLKIDHPQLYQIFSESKAEWQNLSQTKFMKNITYRDLMENPIDKFLLITFNSIKERRTEWEEKEKFLDEITFELIHTPILEEITVSHVYTRHGFRITIRRRVEECNAVAAVAFRQSVCLASQRVSVQARGPSLFRCTLHS